jgi:lipid II:glycine glycyltransferase (peptidoglycan interpeptide bridge formation enzyme)
MQRIDKQNHYISKLNERLAKGETASKGRSEGGRDRKNISKSVDELPELKKKIQANDLLEHLPSPKIGIKLKRY